MSEGFIFDKPHSKDLVEARQAWLLQCLQEIKQSLKHRTAIDVGCGVGYFSCFLRDMGFNVTGVDARKRNVEEARRRNPGIQFHCLDVEDTSIQQMGQFDLVFCFGLLYHLENPMRALRNLAVLTERILLVESICIPGNRPEFLLREEPNLEDQSLTSLALYPSEGSLIKAAYRLGFSYVSRATRLPNHADFRASASRKKMRVILAATRSPLESYSLSAVKEPRDYFDPWMTPPAKIRQLVRLSRGFIRMPLTEKIRVLRKKWETG